MSEEIDATDSYIVNAHFSDEEMSVLMEILEDYRANTSAYSGECIDFFAPERLLDLSQRFMVAQQNSSAEIPVATTDENWISIKREANGYRVRSAESYGILWDAVIGANGPDPNDKAYSEALKRVKRGLTIISIDASELAQLKF